MNRDKNIIAIHLFNDRSGSPKVLRDSLNCLTRAGFSVELFTSQSVDGFLSPSICPVTKVFYPRFGNRFLQMISYLVSQLLLFVGVLWRGRARNAVIYVNTLLPFGAAIAGLALRLPVIYHLHETYIRPRVLKQFLRWIAGITATEIIFVSNYLAQAESLVGVTSQVIPNALPVEECGSGAVRSLNSAQSFTVLMACSLKDYKGVREFVEIADMCCENTGAPIIFRLILNASRSEIERYFGERALPNNLEILGRQTSMDVHYRNAHMVLNLSRPAECIETFGLTLIEAFSWGLPVIAPPIGGPAEIVTDGVDGFLIECSAQSRIKDALVKLANNPALYLSFSTSALEKSKRYDFDVFRERIVDLFDFYFRG